MARDILESRITGEIERLDAERLKLSSRSWSLSEALRNVRLARAEGNITEEAKALTVLRRIWLNTRG